MGILSWRLIPDRFAAPYHLGPEYQVRMSSFSSFAVIPMRTDHQKVINDASMIDREWRTWWMGIGCQRWTKTGGRSSTSES
jgi:hypothetical protein